VYSVLFSSPDPDPDADYDQTPTPTKEKGVVNSLLWNLARPNPPYYRVPIHPSFFLEL
jgi:hypothetical protein